MAIRLTRILQIIVSIGPIHDDTVSGNTLFRLSLSGLCFRRMVFFVLDHHFNKDFQNTDIQRSFSSLNKNMLICYNVPERISKFLIVVYF